jgi:hypothetical protein
MSDPPGVVIAVPARDEAALVQTCLTGLDLSVRYAQHKGLVAEAAVVVVAHRCSDDTAARARPALARIPAAVDVVADDESAAVGAVRDRAARHGLALLGARPAWIFSTDADTVVAPDWISRVLSVATEYDSACVVGLAALDAWYGSLTGLRAYRTVLLDKLHRGPPGDEHRHVYGANLAVRADAYLAVGGFPDVAHGEDQRLVDTLQAAGYPIARTREVIVSTSGRTRGRASGGLADLLRSIGSERSTGSRVAGGRARG